jgi:O-antigen/teichoic acid export membrane protein
MDVNWDKIKNIVKKAKDLQHLALANIIGKAIAGIFWFYAAALLGTEDYGQVSYFVAIGSMAAAFAMIGSSNTIIVYAAKKIPIQPAIYFIVLILGAIASIVVVLLTNSIETGIFTIGFIIFNLAISDLLGKKHYKTYSKIFVIQKILFASLALGLYFIMGFSGIVLGYALSFLVFTFIIVKEFKNVPLDFSLIKKKFGFMINNYALSIERIFNGQIDKIIIAPMFGFAILGNFSLGIQVLSIMSLLPTIVYQYTVSQDATGNRSTIIKKLSIISSIILAICGVMLSPFIVPILFPEFTDAVGIIQIISFVVIPYSVNMTYISKFLGQERGKIILIGQAVSLGIYITGLLTLGSVIGINGVALSLLFSAIGQMIFYICTDKFFINSKIFRPSKNGHF